MEFEARQILLALESKFLSPVICKRKGAIAQILGSSQNGREGNVGEDRNQGRWGTVSLGCGH